MLGKPVARLGDKGSHGGSIVKCASTVFVNGLQMARVGDTYACPKHGSNPIVTGAKSVYGEGQLVAHIGSKTSCGATIVTGSPDTFVGNDSSKGEYIVSEEYFDYDEQIVAIDNATGKAIPYYPYYTETSDGRIFVGRTDEEGQTPRVRTQNPEDLIAFWGEEAVLRGAS